VRRRRPTHVAGPGGLPASAATKAAAAAAEVLEASAVAAADVAAAAATVASRAPSAPPRSRAGWLAAPEFSRRSAAARVAAEPAALDPSDCLMAKGAQFRRC
jgi:hypothetical protein